MAEIRKIDFNKIFKRYKEDEIPTNWYIPAKEVYSFIKDKDKFLYSLWDYIEEYAVAMGEENKDAEN